MQCRRRAADCLWNGLQFNYPGQATAGIQAGRQLKAEPHNNVNEAHTRRAQQINLICISKIQNIQCIASLTCLRNRTGFIFLCYLWVLCLSFYCCFHSYFYFYFILCIFVELRGVQLAEPNT